MSSCAHCGAPFNPVVDGQTVCDRCQGLAHPEPSSPLQQAEVAGFRLLHELGAGRFSHSWLGEDARSHAVVVKLLRRYAPDPDAVHKFLAEAERLATAAELDHPHLARPLSAGVHLVQAFFLVYQGGGELTLADELRQRGRVVPARALELCAQICEGLAALHGAGVLHLDLKPANVGLTRLSDGTEQAIILDGVTAHLVSSSGLRDTAPLPLSTAAYTAPELAEGRGADQRTDLYAVGVLLFQLVSGRLPVRGATSAQRPENAGEAALMMRSLAALATAVPVEDELAEDDPIAILPARTPGASPPQMLPPAVDPALERAMMGHVPPPPPERIPGVPEWAVFVPPRWWPAAAAVVLAGAVAAVLIRSAHERAAPQAGVRPAAVPAAPQALEPA